MGTVAGMLRQVKQLDVAEAARESIEDSRSSLIDYQQYQLFIGTDRFGKFISPPYTANTIARKKRKGQPTDRVTLKDTGRFYSNIFVDVRETTFVVDSDDANTEKLIKKYGEGIFGLNEDTKSSYITYSLGPAFRQKITSITGLKFI